MACNRLLKILKNYTPTGRRNQERPLKRFLDVWDWNGSTIGPNPSYMMKMMVAAVAVVVVVTGYLIVHAN
jgi:hypothetical protein